MICSELASLALLSGAAQSWLAPLVKTSSPLLDNFSAFLEEFEVTFGDTDQCRTSLTKLYSLLKVSQWLKCVIPGIHKSDQAYYSTTTPNICE